MYIQVLSKDLEKKARKELNEIPSQIEENVGHVRDWLTMQPHLNARTDDLWLLNFLRGCKFSLQRTKEKLDFFYTIRSITPEFFEKRDPLSPEIQEFLKRSILVPLESSPTPIVLIRWKQFDPKKDQIQTFLKVCFMLFDIILYENNSCMITGVHLIDDVDGFSVNCLRQFTPAICKKMLITAQKAYPLRVKGIYIVNAVSYFETFFNICKPFMSKKLRDRLRGVFKSCQLYRYNIGVEDTSQVLDSVHLCSTDKNVEFHSNFSQMLAECFPVIAALHNIHEGSVHLDIPLSMAKWQTQNWKQQTHVYSKTEFSQVYKHIPKSALPNEYGGESGSIEEITDKMKNKLESNRSWFLEDAQYRSNENKRLGKQKTSAEIYGLEGSFRKLEVD